MHDLTQNWEESSAISQVHTALVAPTQGRPASRRDHSVGWRDQALTHDPNIVNPSMGRDAGDG